MQLTSRLTEFELEEYIFELHHTLRRYKLKIPRSLAVKYRQEARLEFPLGELTNSGLAEFLRIWHRQGALTLASIGKQDRFDAQGLEGKCVVQTTLSAALRAARELKPYRRAVYLNLILFEPKKHRKERQSNAPSTKKRKIEANRLAQPTVAGRG
ncbi:MAG: hypothetical protein BroJett011_42630 [Chloroflexota bacterium]|nr:MAG: hypothetical protein BroJett011_42630 [Chloroflexota bacterium]